MLIAIVHPDSLVAVGLRHILLHYFDVQAHCFAASQDFIQSRPEQYDGYFITAEVFASCMEALLPRKSRVAIIAQDVDDAWGGLVISPRQPFENIIEVIDNALKCIKRSNSEAESQGELSAREVEVLRCVAKGMINKEIAEELHISINTVLSHRKNIVAKVGIKTVSGLCLYAMMNGIIDAQ